MAPSVAAFAFGCGGSASTPDGTSPENPCAGVSCEVPPLPREVDPDACTGVIIGERVPLVIEPPRAVPFWATRWQDRVVVLAADIVESRATASDSRMRAIELDAEGSSVVDTWALWPTESVQPLDFAVSRDSLAVLSFAAEANEYVLALHLVDLKARATVGERRLVPNTGTALNRPELALTARVVAVEDGWLVLWGEPDSASPSNRHGFAQRYSAAGEPAAERISLGEHAQLRGATTDGKRAMMVVGTADAPRLLFVDGENVSSVPAPDGTTRLAMLRGSIVATGSRAWLLDADGTPIAGPLERQGQALGALGTGYVAIDHVDPTEVHVQALDRKLNPTGTRQFFGRIDRLVSFDPLSTEDSTLIVHMDFASVRLTCAR